MKYGPVFALLTRSYLDRTSLVVQFTFSMLLYKTERKFRNGILCSPWSIPWLLRAPLIPSSVSTECEHRLYLLSFM